MNSDQTSEGLHITANRSTHRIRPGPGSLSTDLLKSGTPFSLLDLLPLRAMRLYTDGKPTLLGKSMGIEIGGAHDGRNST